MRFSKKQLEKVARKYQIADIYLFGSRVSRFGREESDFDIGVRFKKGLPPAEKIGKIYGNLFSDLQDCFPKKKIDLVFIEEVLPHFQFKIVTEGKLLHSEDLKNTYDFKEKVINFYLDYKYFIDEYFQGVLKTI